MSDPAARPAAVIRLSPTLVMVVATGVAEVGAPLSVLLNDQPAPRPHLSVRLEGTGGLAGVALLVRVSGTEADGTILAVRGGDGQDVVMAPVPAATPDGAAALADALRALGAVDRAKALRALFDTAPALFHAQRDAALAAMAEAVLDALFAPPGLPAAPVAAGAGMALFHGALPSGLGAVQCVVAVGGGGVRRCPALPVQRRTGGTLRFHLLVPVDAGYPRAFLVFGAGGVCCRRVAGAPPRDLLGALVAPDGAGLAPECREHVFRALGGAAAAGNAAAGHLLRDAQLYAPAAAAEARNPEEPVGAGVDLVVGHGIGGVFVSGWLRDPYGAVESMAVVFPDGSRRPVDRLSVRFPRPDVATAQNAGPHPAAGGGGLGFASFLPGGGVTFPAYQPAVDIALRSGGRLRVVPPLGPTSLRQTRHRILAAIPPDRLTPDVVAGALATPVDALQRALQDTWRAPDVVSFGAGPAAPSASLIVPLYRNLDYLRFQYAAFALDPAMAGAELIFVLDSPEQRPEVEQVLRCLERLYRLPCRLAVMSENFGFAAASNSGAVIARADRLLFVNSDVLPVGPGWMAPLMDVLDARRDVAAVGPKLLFDDESLQHAGLYFDRDYEGHWFNHHYFKGMPRDYGPAGVARLVPGVTAATLLIRRAVFEDVGGFSEDYVIGDFEDSDLCLKLRAVGHEIAYVPAAELFHYERRSIGQHDGYTASAAGRYNQWLHASRWSDLMAEVMERAPPPLTLHPPVAVA